MAHQVVIPFFFFSRAALLDFSKIEISVSLGTFVRTDSQVVCKSS